jgi:uncharacterized protein YdaU (DUF1376 family)
MNYYEHHIGDYAEATLHLSFVEDAAYSRLIRKYYSTERPLPADLKQVQRLIGARTREEKSAVEVVLKEFFSLGDDGWHNERCDFELAKFRAREPEREVKKANESNRLKKHREERSALFKRLTEAGHHASWNIGIVELRELVKKHCGDSETPAPPLPETAPATPATATQSPVPNTQTPDTSSILSSVVDAQPESREPPPENATRKGVLCKQLRSLGIDAAPHLQGWAELLPAYSDAEIIAAAEQAREKKPGERLHLNYLLPILRDRAAPPPSRNGKPEKFDPVAYVNRNRISTQRNGNAPDDQNVIDITPERLA